MALISQSHDVKSKAPSLRGRIFKPLVAHTRKVKGTATFTNVLQRFLQQESIAYVLVPRLNTSTPSVVNEKQRTAVSRCRQLARVIFLLANERIKFRAV